MIMEQTLQEKLELACWVGKQLFDRRMGPGTTGNLSFLHDGKLYITASGVCFGRMKAEDFSEVDPGTMAWTGKKPSKELPLHVAAYQTRPGTEAVVHVHSTYAVLWSCLPHENEADCVPAYTPYLGMKLGRVGLIDYGKPGSQALFDAFARQAPASDGWILKNHGPVIAGKNLMDAFACLEELEESCRLAWKLRNVSEARRIG